MHRIPALTWLRRHPFAADSILAAALLAFAVGAHWHAPVPPHGTNPSALGTVLSCLSAIPIAARRIKPIAVLAAVTAAEVALGGIGYPNSGWLSLMVAVYTLAAHCNGRPRAIAARIFAVIMLLMLIAGTVEEQVEPGEFVSSVVFFVGVFVLGDNLQRRRLHVAELAEKVERAERERELLSNQRTQEERSRIARELHDVVAHSVSLMIIQAGAARRSIATSPERAEDALRSLEATGRQAMDELRRVLGVLRTADADGTQLSPQPSLRRLQELIDNDPSLPVELVEEGERNLDIPPSVELSLFRVVQEALTNVRKHGGQVRHVNVAINYSPDTVSVSVSDDGRGASVAPNAEGHGLVGMRERMALCGGTVSSGPRPGGGWQVRAAAPIARPHSESTVVIEPSMTSTP